MSLYDAAGGLDGLRALAHAWHERCLAHPIASHPFGHPGQHPDHLERLAAYWAEALGGPALYTGAAQQPASETHVRELHTCNGEHHELDEVCIELFDQALVDVGLTDPAVRDPLAAYFRHVTELHASLEGQPIPAALPVLPWPPLAR